MVTLSDFAPQGSMYAGLVSALRQDTLPHAVLISGMAGVGKRTLARCITQYLLCSGSGKPCGQCPACRQVLAGTHQDVSILQPGQPIAPRVEKGRKTIPVEDIRELIARASRFSFSGGRMVFVICQAETMTVSAQNALLKTLEEPLPGVHILLLSESPRELLTTILSRCREYRLHAWPDEVVRHALDDLQLQEGRKRFAISSSGGSIGKALSLAQDEQYWQRRAQVMQDFFGLSTLADVSVISGKYKEQKDASDELLDELDELLRMLLLVRLGLADGLLLADMGFPEPWQRYARTAPLPCIASLQQAVVEARRQRASNVTWQAVVEQLLYRLIREKDKE